MEDIVRAAILAIAEQDGGTITPDQVVNEARPEGSPLHELFPWDDAAAAHQHRLYIARGIIRGIKVQVTITSFETAAPVFVRDPLAAPHQGYTMLAHVRSNTEQARQVVNDEAGRARSALLRARAVADALGLEDDVDDLVHRVASLRTRALEAAE